MGTKLWIILVAVSTMTSLSHQMDLSSLLGGSAATPAPSPSQGGSMGNQYNQQQGGGGNKLGMKKEGLNKGGLGDKGDKFNKQGMGKQDSGYSQQGYDSGYNQSPPSYNSGYNQKQPNYGSDYKQDGGYNSGYNSGYDKSPPPSYNQGYDQSPPSYNSGYDQSPPPSYNSGYQSPPSYNSGYDQSPPPSYNSGYNQGPSSGYNSGGYSAGPVESPVYGPPPRYDEGYLEPPTGYGPPPPGYGPPPPNYSQKIYRNNPNISELGYDTYRRMYGYNRPSPGGPRDRNGPPGSSYGGPNGYNGPNYSEAGPYPGASRIFGSQGPLPPHIDYSKYVEPLPYSELSDYMSPDKYHDYNGMIYSAYNLPPPPRPPPHHYANYSRPYAPDDYKILVAVVKIDGRLGTPSNANLHGTLFLSEIFPGIIIVTGVIQGFPPKYKYGIAIHAFGDITNGCASIGPHYNPTENTHGNLGYPNSHAGDLGNFGTDGKGVAYLNKIIRKRISIQTRHSVAGRSVGICQKEDDLGLGGNPTSLINGNCGHITACGIIGIANTGFSAYTPPASNNKSYKK